MLKFNPEKNVIFDNEEAAVAPIREITRAEIADLIANGAGVDPSANVGEQTSSPAQTDGDAQAAQDPAVSATGSDTQADAGKPADASSTSPAASSDESAVVNDAIADPGGAGSSELCPTPAAPNLDAQAPASVSSDAVPLDAGGAADAEAGGAEAGESDAALSASQNGSDEHPLTIIGEIEALVRMIGNSAVHEYQRLIQRLADLKNHPTIKDGE
ncbi:hypothetical protein [Caballeronia sp. INML2]|uniref:hypothetical protein n=1 Tax=Caballeronia sp. INML2 TaxID=2921748 RepID=UPI00202972FA|nr:hypothetical protein [Caballeronia sp. INML2]